MPQADFTWLAQINLWQVALVIIAIYIVVRLLVKFWPFLGKVMRLTTALAELPAFITESRQFREETTESVAGIEKSLAAQDKKIADIHHEVHYNNGSSVKDALKRVEDGVAGLYDRVDAGDKSDAEIREELERTRPHPPAVRKRAAKPKENP